MNCRRVMIDRYEAQSPNRAPRPAEIVFRRRDGWTLGAPLDLAEWAYGQWSSDWDAFRLEGEDWRPIAEYHRGRPVKPIDWTVAP